MEVDHVDHTLRSSLDPLEHLFVSVNVYVDMCVSVYRTDGV